MNSRIAPFTISELTENYFEGTSNDEEITRSVRLVSRFQDFSKAILVRFMVFNAAYNNILAMQKCIVVVSFIDGENLGTRRKPPTCRKSLTNFITQCCIEYTLPERGSNKQR